MTAEEMVLQYWGYDADFNPDNLSTELQEGLKSTVALMHAWVERDMVGGHDFERVVVDKLECLHWEVFPRLSADLQREVRLTIVDIELAAIKEINSLKQEIKDHEVSKRFRDELLDETQKKLFGAQLEIDKRGTEIAFLKSDISSKEEGNK
jgi:hypothetical protein